jgi:hypothetical protein
VVVPAAAAAAVLPATGLYYFLKHVIGKYIQASLQDDLSKIEDVYSGKGCFLVAVDTRSENGTFYKWRFYRRNCGRSRS